MIERHFAQLLKIAQNCSKHTAFLHAKSINSCAQQMCGEQWRQVVLNHSILAGSFYLAHQQAYRDAIDEFVSRVLKPQTNQAISALSNEMSDGEWAENVLLIWCDAWRRYTHFERMMQAVYFFVKLTHHVFFIFAEQLIRNPDVYCALVLAERILCRRTCDSDGFLKDKSKGLEALETYINDDEKEVNQRQLEAALSRMVMVIDSFLPYATDQTDPSCVKLRKIRDAWNKGSGTNYALPFFQELRLIFCVGVSSGANTGKEPADEKTVQVIHQKNFAQSEFQHQKNFAQRPLEATLRLSEWYKERLLSVRAASDNQHVFIPPEIVSLIMGYDTFHFTQRQEWCKRV